MLTILSIEQVKAAADTGPKLTYAQQVEVVRRLAQHEFPAEIAKAMKAECGIEISPQAIAYYDPTRFTLKRTPKCWSVLFWKLRAAFNTGKPDVGVVHRTVRLVWLDRMTRAQMDNGNTAEARALMRHAADELSQMAEQQDDGRETDYSKLSDAELEERAAALAARLHGGRGRGDRVGAAEEPQPAGQPLSG